ncbi:DUF4917 family protein [Halomonas sp. 18H]|nr:DUF4917 family protein [Halomonas sp. 18H]MCW4152770.1 DUF4917 family protein [Halomonas sp. 18H]
MTKLYAWNDLKEDFTDTILIGNGASIAIDSRFKYGSLLEQATESGAITEPVKSVFEYFETTDFEFVMEMLWHAAHINSALGVEHADLTNAYASVRSALIAAVRRVHPEYEEVQDIIPRIGDFLAQFKTVLSLNYDLITYWAMLELNSRVRGHWFKDCLVNGILDSRWSRLREPYGAAGATLVFYPHGHLALASNLMGGEEKISASELNNLLSSIVDAWNSGDYSPIFVSEGSSRQKVNSIGRSRYLNTVYTEALPERKRTLTIYGWGVGKQDSHILRQLKAADIQRCAVSVYTRRPGVDEHCNAIRDRLRLYLGRSVEILFFDSSSDGAWIHA